jgi:hypothetical protein
MEDMQPDYGKQGGELGELGYHRIVGKWRFNGGHPV